MVSICGKLKVDKEQNKNGKPSHGTLVFFGQNFTGDVKCEGTSTGSVWVNDKAVDYDDIRLEKAEILYNQYGQCTGFRYAK